MLLFFAWKLRHFCSPREYILSVSERPSWVPAAGAPGGAVLQPVQREARQEHLHLPRTPGIFTEQNNCPLAVPYFIRIFAVKKNLL